MADDSFPYETKTYLLAATHAVAAVQTFIAGTAANGYMTAGIAGRGVALHILSSHIHGINATRFRFCILRCSLVLYRLRTGAR